MVPVKCTFNLGSSSWNNPIVDAAEHVVVLANPHNFSPQEASCAYVLIVTAVYWVSEAVPLGAAALVPAFLYPLFGVMKSSEVRPKHTFYHFFFHYVNYLQQINLSRVTGLRVCVGSKKAQISPMQCLGQFSKLWQEQSEECLY